MDSFDTYSKDGAYDEERDKNALESIKVQLQEIDKDTEGLFVFTYGSPDYMVSGKAATRILRRVTPFLKEKFPEMVTLLVPHYMELTTLKLKDLLDATPE